LGFYFSLVSIELFLKLVFWLIYNEGAGIAFVLPCVANDLTAIATDLIAERNVTGDNRDAYAQAFALFNCGIASGTVLGPLWMSSMSILGW
jgi:hypothetical protein